MEPTPTFEQSLAGTCTTAAIDPRDPDPSRTGIFRDHNCYRCDNGKYPCVVGTPNRCEFPHARND